MGWDMALDALVEAAKDTVTQIEEDLSEFQFGETLRDQADGLDGAAAQAVHLLGDALRLIEALRAKGADLDDPPETEEATALLFANIPKLVADSDRRSQEAIATIEMVAERLRSK